MKSKSWPMLKREVEVSKISALVCNQNFDETRQDSIDDDPTLSDDERKQDVMFRVLQENLDYGAYEDAPEEDGDALQHNLEMRTKACDMAARMWVEGEVSSIEEAQAFVSSFLSSQQ